MSDMINIEVIYAQRDYSDRVTLQLPAEATVEQAITASGLLDKYPEIDVSATHKVGIFAKLSKLDAKLRDRDRVEIYRPLIADPKTARRKKAAERKNAQQGVTKMATEDVPPSSAS